jgi:phage shock protein PspC (stress-responsive transcriptional regulator)
MLRDWLRGSAGVFGCFGVCFGLLCVAIIIMWQIMDSMSQADAR